MLYWMVKRTKKKSTNGKSVYHPLTEQQLKHAIKRNFDGLNEFDATEIFLSKIRFPVSVGQVSVSYTSAEEEEVWNLQCILCISNTILGILCITKCIYYS